MPTPMAMCERYSDEDVRHSMVQAPLSVATRQVYMDAMRRAQGVLGGMSVCEILMRPNESFERLDKALKMRQTLGTTVGGLLAILKHSGMREDLEFGGKATRFGKRWQALYKPLMKEWDERRKEGKPTDRQEAGAVSWLRVVEKNEELTGVALPRKNKATVVQVEDALLSSFYVDMEPRRQTEYHKIFIMRNETDKAAAVKESAHVDLMAKRPVIVVKEHKTARAADGPWNAELPARTVQLLRRLPVTRKYVFARDDGKPYTTKGYTDYHNRKLKAWFGEKVSNNSLRHARASVIQSDFTMTTGEKDAAAEAMGHTPGMNKRYAYRAVAMGKGDTVEIMGRRKDGRPVVYECKPKESSMTKQNGTRSSTAGSPSRGSDDFAAALGVDRASWTAANKRARRAAETGPGCARRTSNYPAGWTPTSAGTDGVSVCVTLSKPVVPRGPTVEAKPVSKKASYEERLAAFVGQHGGRQKIHGIGDDPGRVTLSQTALKEATGKMAIQALSCWTWKTTHVMCFEKMLGVQAMVNDILVAEYIEDTWYARWKMLLWRRKRSVIMQHYAATIRHVALPGTPVVYGYGDAGFAACRRGEQAVPTTGKIYLLHRVASCLRDVNPSIATPVDEMRTTMCCHGCGEVMVDIKPPKRFAAEKVPALRGLKLCRGCGVNGNGHRLVASEMVAEDEEGGLVREALNAMISGGERPEYLRPRPRAKRPPRIRSGTIVAS
eukprot:gene17727-24087_t